MLNVKLFAVNPFREITYVVSDTTGECIIIDCGCSSPQEKDRLEDYISRNELKPVLAVNTHAHIDHILGVNFIQERYGIPFALHSADRPVLESGKLHGLQIGLDCSELILPEIDIDLAGQEQITFGASTLRVIPTPGHTPGHVSLFSETDKILFTGDTVFQGSIGRTDLPGGNYDVLIKSILENILPLGGDVTVYPGHGNHTTIAHEAMYNPFITEVLQGGFNQPYEV